VFVADRGPSPWEPLSLTETATLTEKFAGRQSGKEGSGGLSLGGKRLQCRKNDPRGLSLFASKWGKKYLGQLKIRFPFPANEGVIEIY